MFDKFISKIKAWWVTDVPINLTSHHISWLLAALIIINAGIFTVGYYWGKRTGAQQLCATISRDAFADQIYNSLCLASAGTQEEHDDEETDTASDENEGSEAVAQSDAESVDSSADPLEVKPQFYAQLAGFTSFKKAEGFVCRLQKRQIPVLIKERISRTCKGRSLTWYQVVTEPYEDQDALNSVVAILKKEEKLHDVRIVQG